MHNYYYSNSIIISFISFDNANQLCGNQVISQTKTLIGSSFIKGKENAFVL